MLVGIGDQHCVFSLVITLQLDQGNELISVMVYFPKDLFGLGVDSHKGIKGSGGNQVFSQSIFDLLLFGHFELAQTVSIDRA